MCLDAHSVKSLVSLNYTRCGATLHSLILWVIWRQPLFSSISGLQDVGLQMWACRKFNVSTTLAKCSCLFRPIHCFTTYELYYQSTNGNTNIIGEINCWIITQSSFIEVISLRCCNCFLFYSAFYSTYLCPSLWDTLTVVVSSFLWVFPFMQLSLFPWKETFFWLTVLLGKFIYV